MALNLEPDNVGVVLLGDDRLIKEGETVRCTGRVMEVPVGKEIIGRIIDPLGQPLDGKGPIKTTKFRLLEERAKGVVDRQPVTEPLQTGLKCIDSMIPIGRGQRELIIGDRRHRKTAVAIDTILNQKGTGVICIYVAIGQKQSSVARVHKVLEDFGAMEYTIIVCASASDPAAAGNTSHPMPAAPLVKKSATRGAMRASYTTKPFQTCRCLSRTFAPASQAPGS